MDSKMNSPPFSQLERLSALADDQVQGDDFANAMAEIAMNDQLNQSWHVYQVIGDVMRSDELAPTSHELRFWDRLEATLEAEKELITPSIFKIAPIAAKQTSANEWSVRKKWVGGASFSAIVALVVVGAWQMEEGASQWVSNTSRRDMVTSAPSATVIDAQSVIVRDPELDALMSAHQQFGGHSAFQMPSGFLRNATFERPQR
jgi:sigma-E factor negative regulatory protein RseA